MGEESTNTADVPAKPYVVQPQDTVLTIALMHEVEVDAILSHPDNQRIFDELDRDPHMLAPGEILYVPDPEPPRATVVPQTENRFVARVPWVMLHLHFDSEAGPLSGERFVIEGPAALPDQKRPNDAEPLEGELDSEGNLSVRVPALTKSLYISFPERHIEHEILVGGLDPIDQRTGLGARLLHRGYLPLDQELLDPYVFESETAERETLKSFQTAFQLEPSGFVDPPTRERIEREHGS